MTADGWCEGRAIPEVENMPKITIDSIRISGVEHPIRSIDDLRAVRELLTLAIRSHPRKSKYVERDKDINSAILSGIPIKEVACNYGLTISAIYAVLNKFDTKMSRLSPRVVDTDRDSDICELRLAGVSLNAIGKQFGLSRQRVHQILKKLGKKEG